MQGIRILVLLGFLFGYCEVAEGQVVEGYRWYFRELSRGGYRDADFDALENTLDSVIDFVDSSFVFDEECVYNYLELYTESIPSNESDTIYGLFKRGKESHHFFFMHFGMAGFFTIGNDTILTKQLSPALFLNVSWRFVEISPGSCRSVIGEEGFMYYFIKFKLINGRLEIYHEKAIFN